MCFGDSKRDRSPPSEPHARPASKQALEDFQRQENAKARNIALKEAAEHRQAEKERQERETEAHKNLSDGDLHFYAI